MAYQEAINRIKQLEAYEAKFESSEFNFDPINKIQRAKIRTARKLNRQNHCFIYSVNEPYGDNWIVKEYYKGMVLNFTGAFVMGYLDSEIVKLIEQWRTMDRGWCCKEGFKVLDQIFATPELIFLNWV